MAKEARPRSEKSSGEGPGRMEEAGLAREGHLLDRVSVILHKNYSFFKGALSLLRVVSYGWSLPYHWEGRAQLSQVVRS